MLLAYLGQLAHFVLAVLAVVVFEVKVFGHECIQSDYIEEMVDMVPVGSAFLIKLIFLHGCNDGLAVGLNKWVQCIFALLGIFLVVVHLEFNNDMLFQQEVFQVLESNTLAETFP